MRRALAIALWTALGVVWLLGMTAGFAGADCGLDRRADVLLCRADEAVAIADCAWWRALEVDDDPALARVEENECRREARDDRGACVADLESCSP